MASVLEEVRLAQSTLGISPADLRELPPAESSAVFHSALEHFVVGGDRRWWWEAFRKPCARRTFSDGSAWRHLPEVVPDANEPIWFITEDDSLPHYPVLETSTANAARIISECYGFEYYLVAKDLSWLVCETHHNDVFAVGAVVEERLLRFSGQLENHE